MTCLLFMAIISHLMTSTPFSYNGSSSHRITPLPALSVTWYIMKIQVILTSIVNTARFFFLFFHLLKCWQVQNHIQLVLFRNLTAIEACQTQAVQLFLVGTILFLHYFFPSCWREMMGTSCSVSKPYLTVNDLSSYPKVGPAVVYCSVNYNV